MPCSYATAWSPPPPTRPEKFLFRGERRQNLIDDCARVLRLGEPTLFAFSARSLYLLRAWLCLRGWPWKVAHQTATEIVISALGQISARLPSWIEGQREFTSLGFCMRMDVACWQCGDALPRFKKKFCSPTCQEAWRHSPYSYLDQEPDEEKIETTPARVIHFEARILKATVAFKGRASLRKEQGRARVARR